MYKYMYIFIMMLKTKLKTFFKLTNLNNQKKSKDERHKGYTAYEQLPKHLLVGLVILVRY